MTKNGQTITVKQNEWRICQLEKNYQDLEAKMDLLLENHLPHLKEEVLGLKTRINVLTAVNVGAIVFGIILSKYL